MKDLHKRSDWPHPGKVAVNRYHVMTTGLWLLLILNSVSVSASSSDTRTRIVEDACGTYDVAREVTDARGIGGAILGGIIQNTLGRIGAALRSAGEESTKSTVAHRNIEVAPGRAARCLIIARGRWSSSRTDVYRDKSGNEVAYSGATTEKLLRRPDFVLRVNLLKSSDHTALKLQPAYLDYSRHLADAKKGERGLALEIAFHGPGQASDHAEAVGTSLVLGDFEPGRRYDLITGEIEEWEDGSWQPSEDTQVPIQEESSWFPTYAPKLADGADPQAGNLKSPKIITATIAETRAARPILLFFADVFDASKDEIQAALESKLIRSQIEEAQAAAATEKNAQLVAFVTAVADANLALLGYCALEEIDEANDDAATKSQKLMGYLTARKALFVAMNKANVAAGAAGQPLPFPQVPRPEAQSPGDWAQCPI